MGSPSDRLTIIATESQRFAAVLATSDPDARVPTCPGWTALDLAWHLTEVHLFWAGVLSLSTTDPAGLDRVEGSTPPRPGDMAGVLAVRTQATDALIAALTDLDDAEPRWSWWDPDQTVGFTRRMQAYEATIQ
ncbi:maleylpyruvate isomerase N-terminal domain-containing protein [Williamsia sp. CHRR-6]|uniref:maleylpyruvate isomerase N-terminal domain-containing protein n=1 Tax=Williamsia sp. CHRR-6 TaxID=2835871 RepID=UPI001BDA9A5B|nr:maleylpyruvate isomerase N-terminal domain-containing protein [Williamsia sp. CHRR-6]MBT0567872.1 maleylpyruvate isomerase N-terminal domain-containing protein [Williamsia sp. CHRR-6]